MRDGESESVTDRQANNKVNKKRDIKRHFMLGIHNCISERNVKIL